MFDVHVRKNVKPYTMDAKEMMKRTKQFAID